MRVLMILDWNRGQGGAEAHALALRDGLRAAGDDVRLLTSSAGSAGDGQADYVAFGTENPAAQALLQIANPFAVSAVRRAVSAFNPDVVWVNMFAHHLSPAAVLALAGRPMVLLVSDYKLICPIGSKLRPDGSECTAPAGRICLTAGCTGAAHWLRDRPRYALMRAAARRARRVMACSDWVTGRLAAEAGIAAETLHLPTPPPDPTFVRRPAPHPTFLYFGRLDREKGVDLLIRAFARLHVMRPDARLRVVGRGPERVALEALAVRLRVSAAVAFEGWMSREQLDGPLAEAWATVAPSTWAEPQGLVAIEAIVRGVPPIVSASGGLVEIVDDRVNGLHFPPGDEDALLDRLERVASGRAFAGPTLPYDVVETARRRFAPARHIERIRAVFRTAIEETRR